MTRTFALALLLAIAASAQSQSPQTSDWGYYGGDLFGQRYSALTQVNRANVDRLEVAWTYRTGELGEGFASAGKMAFEATPVLAFDLLYLTTPTNIVVALDPATGQERWRYDSRIPRDRRYGEATSRGVTVWQDVRPAAAEGACATRVFAGTLDARLVALDARTGKPCTDFGASGAVDLTAGIRLRDASDYVVTAPPAMYRDLVIVGSAIGDNRAVELERGTVRAFDARTGALRWSFDPIPDSRSHPSAAGWQPEQAQRTGGANAWAVMSVDPARGIVFVPTGSASPDFFGGERLGANRFANSLLALDASSGKLLWHHQTVHHDLWDYDLAAQPMLVDLDLELGSVAAVVQATKTGMLFVYDRENGAPVFPVSERRVPPSNVPGEVAAPTQPFSSLPPLSSHGPLDPAQAWGVTFWDRGECRAMIRGLRNEGLFTPPDPRGSLSYPSYVGGVNWGGIAYDARRRRVIAAVNHVPAVVTLLTSSQLEAQLEEQRRDDRYPNSEFARQRGAPYGMRREPLLSPWGLPCSPPPWGTLVSVDLEEQRIVWEVPLGSTEGIAPWFVPTRDFGLPHMGGPIATAGNLVFIGGAMDGYFRAFDLETGRELWKHRLPAGGQATPMTYRAGPEQRQFIVIAAGGHGGLGTEQGDYVVAFALPRR
jgi:quinoprotein glucose dehydrogenase